MTRGGLINKNTNVSSVTNSATGIFPLRDVLAERVDDNWTTNAFLADVLLVAGGGCGSRDFGGGGGAGGLVYQQNRVLGFGTHNITVGAGGVLNTTGGTNGFKTTYVNSSTANGNNTTAFSLTAIGGGAGHQNDGGNVGSSAHGNDGGSGGGGFRGMNQSLPGDGTQPNQSGDSGTYGFGNDGGSSGATGNDWAGGSGGGAGSAGKGNVTSGNGSLSTQPNSSSRAGDGGDGKGIAIEGQRSAVSVSAVGNAQVSTAQWKFGGQSALFDGTSDFLNYIPASTTFGTADFTIEGWFRTTARTQSYPLLWQTRSSFDTGAIGIYERHDINNTKLSVWVRNEIDDAPVITSTTTIVDSTWYHVAVVRDGSTLRLFIDGTQEGTHTIVNSNIDNGASSTSHYLGGIPNLSSASYHGYLDEWRLSNTARYTANFTPPTKQFTNDLNTLLLLHMNGTNGSTTFTDDNVIYYAGGGGGGVSNRYGGNSAFGFGNHGGGNASDGNRVGEDGQANTGGGGGGGGRGSGLYDAWDGGDGGSGLVVIRTSATASATTGSPTTTTDGSYNIYKFTGSGSITF